MTGASKRAWGLTLLLVLLAGCARSPEAKRDRYLERGKKLLAGKEYNRALLEFRSAAQAMPKDAEPYYQMGIASLAARDYGSAVASFRKALELNPKHPEAQLKMAQLMASASDPAWAKEAEARLKALMENGPVTPETLVTLAGTAIKLGNADAVQTLAKALEKAPQELFLSIMLAREKLLKKDVKGAESVLINAYKASPDAADPRVVLGEFYQAQKRIAEAEAEFQRALKINPKSGTALMALARLQMSQARDQEAGETFKRAAGLDEKSYKPVYALFLYEKGRHDEAIREFERLAKEDPEDHATRAQLVAAYRGANRPKGAEDFLERILKKNPKDLDALLQRGLISIASRNYDRAETDLNQVLHLKPDSAEVHYALARLHRTRGAALTYRQELSEALRLNPDLLSVRLELAQHLTETKAARTALEILGAAPDSQKQLTSVIVQRNWVLWSLGDLAEMRKGIDAGLSRERSADLLVQDGLWKLRAGNASAARAALEEALKMNPDDLRALAGLKDAYTSQKQAPLALEKVKEHARQQPKSAAVQEFLGIMLMANGNRQQARAAFEAAKAADPKFVRADLSLTQTDLIEGRLDDAHRRLKTVVSSDGGNMLARLWLGNIEAMTGDHKAATEQFRQVVAADPGNAQALNNLAYLLAEYGNQSEEALKYAQKAQELAPDTAEYRDTLGWIYYRKGLYPLAIRELELAATKNANALWQYHLAMAYAKAGDLNRGRTTLQAALKQNPHLPEAKVAQEMLGAVK